MYTGLKNKAIGEIFGVSLSAVNKAALRVSYTKEKTKGSWRENREDCVFCFQGLTPFKTFTHLLDRSLVGCS